MRTHEFWREHGGGVWAVELDDGVVVGCCGPLDVSEIDEALFDAFEYSNERARWFDANRDAFDVFEPTRPYG